MRLSRRSPSDRPAVVSEKLRASQLEMFRDDGGSPPYADPTGQEAVWRLTRGEIPAGEYVVTGPFRFGLRVDTEMVAFLLRCATVTPTRRGSGLRAHLDKKKAVSLLQQLDGSKSSIDAID